MRIEQGRRDGLHVNGSALTAPAFDCDRICTLAAGFDDFDIRPIDLERPVGKVTRYGTEGRG